MKKLIAVFFVYSHLFILTSTQAMMFKSLLVPNIWDTWVYCADNKFYLYYLIAVGGDTDWQGFGVAVSEDGVHWHDHGWALHASDKMTRYLGTGAVLKAVDFDKSHRYICNYSEWRKAEVENAVTQNIFFAWSTDLIHWTKYGDEEAFRIDDRYYGKFGRWDCIYPIARPGGGYWGIWTANPASGQPQSGVGLGESEDGLHWKALPPPAVLPPVAEAGAFWPFGSRIYAMFGGGGGEWKLPWGTMWNYSADKIEGPYNRSEKNAALLPTGRDVYTYFSRFFALPDGTVLVNHQSRSGVGWYVAPFKRAVIDSEGILRLMYWQGNEALKGKEVPVSKAGFSNSLAMVTESLDMSEGFIAEGTIQLPKSREESRGFYILPQGQQGHAIKVWKDGHAEFGRQDPFGGNWQPELLVDRDQVYSNPAKFRLLVRRGMVELYLNDYLVSCYSLLNPGRSDAAQLGFLGGNSPTFLSDLKLWKMSLDGNPVASASSERQQDSENRRDFFATNAMDGDGLTEWRSKKAGLNPEWLQIDFHTDKVFSRATINWGKDYASSHCLMTSDDGKTWQAIYETEKGVGKTETLNGLNGHGRYLRLALLKPARADQEGYSISEINVP